MYPIHHKMIPSLVSSNQHFEKTVTLAENFLQKVGYADGGTSPSDSAQFSSDDEDFEESKLSETGKRNGTEPSSPPF